MKKYAIVKIKEEALTNDVLNLLAEKNGDIFFMNITDGIYSIIFAKEKRKKAETEHSDFVERLTEIGVSSEAAEEWLKIRKKKKAVNSNIAIDSIVKELSDIEKEFTISADDAVKHCVVKSWMGVKKEWFERDFEHKRNEPQNDSLVINGVVFK